jgi:hypothetical protein
MPAAAGPRRRQGQAGGLGGGRRGRSRGRRPTAASPAPAGPGQQLPEAGDQVKSVLEPLVDRVDAEVTVAVEQAGAIQDGEPADVGGPAVVVPQQHEQVGCGQPFQEPCLIHHATLSPLWCATFPLGNPEAEAPQGTGCTAARLLGRALWLFGDEDPHEQVDHQAGAAEQGEYHEQHPDQGCVDVGVLARPPHTPASLRSVRLRYSRRVWATVPMVFSFLLPSRLWVTPVWVRGWRRPGA